MYDKDVTALIDMDNKNKTYASALTKYLRRIDGLSLIEHNPDMETEYGIDTNVLNKYPNERRFVPNHFCL